MHSDGTSRLSTVSAKRGQPGVFLGACGGQGGVLVVEAVVASTSLEDADTAVIERTEGLVVGCCARLSLPDAHLLAALRLAAVCCYVLFRSFSCMVDGMHQVAVRHERLMRAAHQISLVE